METRPHLASNSPPKLACHQRPLSCIAKHLEHGLRSGMVPDRSHSGGGSSEGNMFPTDKAPLGRTRECSHLLSCLSNSFRIITCPPERVEFEFGVLRAFNTIFPK